jgi:hypothetical protein
MKSNTHLGHGSTHKPIKRRETPSKPLPENDREARIESYSLMAQWVRALPLTRSRREARYREQLLRAIALELQDLDRQAKR